MTRKIILGAIVAAVFAIGALGVLNINSNNDSNSFLETTQTNFMIQKAYAASPNHEIVLVQNATGAIVTSTDYGLGSGFDIEKILWFGDIT